MQTMIDDVAMEEAEKEEDQGEEKETVWVEEGERKKMS